MPDAFEEFLRGKNQQPLDLDAARTALLVVDMQRYFARPGYPFTDVYEKLSPGASKPYLERVEATVIPAIQKLLSRFRKLGAPIVFTAVGTEGRNGADLPNWLRSFDQLGLQVLGRRIWPPVEDPSWRVDPALEPQPGELVINKLSAGAFATTGLDQRLRRAGVDSVVVTGVATDVCVSTTAREAADRNYRTVVVGDACATLSDAIHHANLVSLNVFGQVRDTADVLAALRVQS